MSNRVYANVNKVENVKTGKIYYEIDIYDAYEYGSIDIEKEQIPATDLDLLQHLIDYGSDESEKITGILDFLLEHGKGITINDTLYDWGEIKHLWGLEEEGEQ